MILKGSQRSGAGQLAAHLLNERDNEHVRVAEIRGFAADDLRCALVEAQAVSKGTKCKQFLFSLSLNPPHEAQASEADFRRAADEAEKALGLSGQPRAIVFHEKEGRRHAHVVWSRIDADHMRAINMAHFKRRLTSLSRELYLEHGWTLPDGLKRDGGRNPLNFTLAEWQQAKRIGRDPREIKEVFRDAWTQSDSLKAMSAALAERGYFVAKGDRRGLVAVDLEGEVYALARWAGVKTREARGRLGDGANLPGVDDVRKEIDRLVSGQMKGFIRDTRARQARELLPLKGEAKALAARHGGERGLLERKQAERWARETEERQLRMRAGLAGFWDTVTGRARTIRRANEREAIQGFRRDRAQRDTLIWAQLKERQPLQARLETMRKRHLRERQNLARDIVGHLRTRARSRDRDPGRHHDHGPER